MGMVQLESSDECSDEDEEEGSNWEGEKAGTKDSPDGEASRLDADAGIIIQFNSKYFIFNTTHSTYTFLFTHRVEKGGSRRQSLFGFVH